MISEGFLLYVSPSFWLNAFINIFLCLIFQLEGQQSHGTLDLPGLGSSQSCDLGPHGKIRAIFALKGLLDIFCLIRKSALLFATDKQLLDLFIINESFLIFS